MTQRIFEVIYIRATAESVWRALTDADVTERYWFDTRIVSDWRVGSTVEYLRHGEITDRHVVLACDPPHRLSHTFRPLFGEFLLEPPSRVELILSNLKTLLESGVPLPHFEFAPQPARFV